MNRERAKYLKKDFVLGFPAYLGFQADKIEDGLFQSRLQIRPEYKQQDGFVHAGIIATLADHTAGYAAYSVVPKNVRILTIEFKINFFKPAIGEVLICKSKVISTGKKIIISESKVFVDSEDKESLISQALVTLRAISSPIKMVS
ncbi:MAG: PaaI family thioesterase [Candidatus Lokiarchaeota archaeon]|nr:PaaI family thioesterase [Candidatus Lokiarchaeota archaeon]